MPDKPVADFWQNQNLPIAVAHRGGDAVGIEKENSLAAVEAAHKLGYMWFETDVVPTKDGKLLAIHGRGYQLHPNRDLPRRRLVTNKTYAELKQELRVGGEPPILFEELIKVFPDTKWFVDPKLEEAVGPLVELLSDKSLDLGRISVGSFIQRRTQAVAAAVKQNRRDYLCTTLGPIGAYAILNRAGIRSGKLEPRDFWLLELFKKTGRLRKLEEIVNESGATSVHVPYNWVNHSENFVGVAHELGLKVATWTPNSSEDIQLSIERGVDAIMSDNVKELKKAVLADNPKNLSIRA